MDMRTTQSSSLTTQISERTFRERNLGASVKPEELSRGVQRTSTQRSSALILCGVSMYRTP